MIAPALLADGPGGALVGPSGEAPSWRLAAGEAIFHGGDESLDDGEEFSLGTDRRDPNSHP